MPHHVRLAGAAVIAAFILAAAPASAADMPPMGPPQALADWVKGAQRFTGLGDFHRKITTRSAAAQAYFDQGMRLLWAFNHDEAARSFAKAAEIDPRCASCYWGVALTLGPNYNMPMMAEARAKVGWAALTRAQSLATGSSPVEQALIAALARRFAGDKPLDPASGAPLLAAYAAAMADVAHRFPDDLDVQTLYAEALMNKNPWKLWSTDGAPAADTPEIVRTLEHVLAKDPRHPGANHYYVHAMEASPTPEKAVTAAERLVSMMPAAGHIDHMPAHILQRVGRYEDAAEANRKGAAADAAYYKLTTAPDYYPMYTAHNFQFLAASAAMEGRRAETMTAVRASRAALSDDMLAGDMVGVDWYVAFLYDAMVRFGLWDEILAEPKPTDRLPGLTIAWLQARTIALAAKGRIADAETTLAALDKTVAAAPADASAGQNQGKSLYAIALLKAKARVALAKGDRAGAVALLSEAVKDEDKLDYDEPNDAFFPSRHLLGAVLLQAGKPAEAEAVYREDLKRNPGNGWALYGLAAALKAENHAAEAAAAHRRFLVAWRHADTPITASAF